MIFPRRCLQTPRPNTNDGSLYNFSSSPRKTNYIFRKQKQAVDIQINCLPNMKSIIQQDVLPMTSRQSNSRKATSTHIQPTNQISCTTFMKSYIQKLKKQRKRQCKKQIHSKREKNQADKNSPNHRVSIDSSQVFMTKQMNHIFILQRVCKNGNNSLANTISVVEQDSNNILVKAKKYKQGINENRWEQPTWVNKDRLDKLIKQMRWSKNVQDLPQQNQTKKSFKDPSHYFFPSLRQKSRDVKSRAKSKQVRRVPQAIFKSLQPWNLDQNIQQFSIEQYYQKQEQRTR